MWRSCGSNLARRGAQYADPSRIARSSVSSMRLAQADAADAAPKRFRCDCRFAACSLFRCLTPCEPRHFWGVQMLSGGAHRLPSDLLRIGSVLSETYWKTLASMHSRFLEVR